MTMKSLNKSFENKMTLRGDDTSLNLYASTITSPLEIDVSVNGTVGTVSKLSDAKYVAINGPALYAPIDSSTNEIVEYIKEFYRPSSVRSLNSTLDVSNSYFDTMVQLFAINDMSNGFIEGILMDVSQSTDVSKQHIILCEIFTSKETLDFAGRQWLASFSETFSYVLKVNPYFDDIYSIFTDPSLNTNLQYNLKSTKESQLYNNLEWKKYFVGLVYLASKSRKEFENGCNGCTYSYHYNSNTNNFTGKRGRQGTIVDGAKTRITIDDKILQTPFYSLRDNSNFNSFDLSFTLEHHVTVDANNNLLVDQ